MATAPTHMTVTLPVTVGSRHIGDITVRVPISYGSDGPEAAGVPTDYWYTPTP